MQPRRRRRDGFCFSYESLNCNAQDSTIEFTCCTTQRKICEPANNSKTILVLLSGQGNARFLGNRDMFYYTPASLDPATKLNRLCLVNSIPIPNQGPTHKKHDGPPAPKTLRRPEKEELRDRHTSLFAPDVSRHHPCPHTTTLVVSLSPPPHSHTSHQTPSAPKPVLHTHTLSAYTRLRRQPRSDTSRAPR